VYLGHRCRWCLLRQALHGLLRLRFRTERAGRRYDGAVPSREGGRRRSPQDLHRQPSLRPGRKVRRSRRLPLYRRRDILRSRRVHRIDADQERLRQFAPVYLERRRLSQFNRLCVYVGLQDRVYCRRGLRNRELLRIGRMQTQGNRYVFERY